MTEAFKPCPFCGKADNLTITTAESYEKWKGGLTCIAIKCRACNAELIEFNIDHKDKSYAAVVSALVKRWNTRP